MMTTILFAMALISMSCAIWTVDMRQHVVKSS